MVLISLIVQLKSSKVIWNVWGNKSSFYSKKWFISTSFTSSYNDFITSECNLIKSRWVCFKNLSQCSMHFMRFGAFGALCMSLCLVHTFFSILLDPPHSWLYWLYYAENFSLLACFAIEFILSEVKIVIIMEFRFSVCRCTRVNSIQCITFWVIFDGTLVVFLKTFTLQILLNVSH